MKISDIDKVLRFRNARNHLLSAQEDLSAPSHGKRLNGCKVVCDALTSESSVALLAVAATAIQGYERQLMALGVNLTTADADDPLDSLRVGDISDIYSG